MTETSPTQIAIPDGRRARSERSKEKIADAVLALVQRGDLHPSAERVAEHAKVSVRTVYRHFEDLESLYQEISAACEAKTLPIFMRPYASTEWKSQIREHLDRRMLAFEEIRFLRLCTNARRFQSAALMQEYKRHIQLERLGLEALLPDHLKTSSKLVAAFDVALSFETYNRLREDNNLSSQKAKDVIAHMVETLLDTAAD